MGKKHVFTVQDVANFLQQYEEFDGCQDQSAAFALRECFGHLEDPEPEGDKLTDKERRIQERAKDAKNATGYYYYMGLIRELCLIVDRLAPKPMSPKEKRIAELKAELEKLEASED